MNKLNTLPEQIKSKISIDPSSACWIWQGNTSNGGYGTFWDRRLKRTNLTHRIVYELFHNPVLKPLQIDHLCKNKLCCNPAHMELVTARINIFRSDNICAQNMRKLFCKNGHPFTKENTIWRIKGGRKCRLCHNLEESIRRAKDPEKCREATRKWRRQ